MRAMADGQVLGGVTSQMASWESKKRVMIRWDHFFFGGSDNAIKCWYGN